MEVLESVRRIGGDHYKFTGDEHDSESNLEHTMYRQYEAVQGRWLSADPYSGSMDSTNPQSLNRYAYVGNNPMGTNDPSGLRMCVSDGDTGQSCTNMTLSDPSSFSSKYDDTFWNGGTAFGAGVGSATNCILDGVSTPCSVVAGLIHAGAAAPCPQCQPGDTVGADNAVYRYNKQDPGWYPVSPIDEADAMFLNYGIYQRSLRENPGHPPTAEDYAKAIHDAFANFPNVCSLGINGSVGGNRGSAGLDANTNRGLNPFGQASTPIAPYTSARYNIGTNGETPRLSLRVGPPTGFAGTMGFTSSGKITSAGANFQITFPKLGKAGATAYAGIGSFYQCK